MHPLLAVTIAYLSGSIPAAYLAGRMYGVDLRSQGSGNLGATNVMRVLGARIGMAVYAFDVAKGALPVLLLPAKVALPESWLGASNDPQLLLAVAFGMAAILGHVRPIFMKFGRGGKGVATASGVFVALAPLETLLTLVAFSVTVLASGYVSLGSLLSAVLMPVLLAITRGYSSMLVILATLVAAFVIWTHRANIGRLRRGEENRFGKRDVTRRRPAAMVAIAAAITVAITLAARFR